VHKLQGHTVHKWIGEVVVEDELQVQDRRQGHHRPGLTHVEQRQHKLNVDALVVVLVLHPVGEKLDFLFKHVRPQTLVVYSVTWLFEVVHDARNQLLDTYHDEFFHLSHYLHQQYQNFHPKFLIWQNIEIQYVERIFCSQTSRFGIRERIAESQNTHLNYNCQNGEELFFEGVISCKNGEHVKHFIFPNLTSNLVEWSIVEIFVV